MSMFALPSQMVPVDLGDVVDTSDVTEWHLLGAVVTVVAAALLGRLFAALARRAGRKAMLPANVIDLISTIVVWSTVTAGAVLALTMIGLNATPLWFLIFLFVLMFVVGGRALLEAFGAGVMLQARAPFAPGDLVQLGRHQGVVVEVNSRVVVLDLVDGRRVYIPNQQVLRSEIINLSHRDGRMAELALDVAYGTDLGHACRVALDAVTGLDHVRSEPCPKVQVSSFEESAVRLVLRFWHAPELPAEWAANDAATRATYSAYEAHGIEFAFPQQTLWWGSGQHPSRSA